MALHTEYLEIETAIREITDRIVAQFDPLKVILFGSHARGTATPDSDVDILVVKEIHGSKRKERIAIGVALHDIHVPKDILVASPEDVVKFGNTVGTVLYPAFQEGKVLYEKTFA
ncbi:MAG: nucleotidyltransferase domain-containing protein [Candidatus Latescibacteria bacterium]|nr:nucleotidyltransferase domain-containing protein [Candidatus Latescibacterota bacterium]MBT4136912.1 nucleotidyltransferase domain-containing protein [Candidatus Latescibacterota bacterium]MBT5831820.1 nucleotidyltransferase domain-containing protein [Candidatus Latescibacterota bacterium]